MDSDIPPYQLHTNRELGMMLRGEKPLAVFSDAVDQFPEAVLRYLRFFDRHVSAGRLIKQEEILPPGDWRTFHVQRIYFALPGEEWRIEAMKELKRSGTWSLAHERREGELLGYEDWQNDWFIDQQKKRGLRG